MQATAVAAAADPAPAAIQPDLFVKVPATTLPNGTIVPGFEVGQYLCSKGPRGLPVVSHEGTPWTRIRYAAAREACAAAGFALITELQALAIAHNIAQQDANWSGGKVGEGELYRGLHKRSVNSAQPGTYEPTDPDERRWFVLSNGERIYDVAGNAYTWIFDDVQGDATGIVAKAFAADSPSIKTPPYLPEVKGVGWYPTLDEEDEEDEIDWSGSALIRGGCWGSDSSAGVFYLYGGWPVDALDYVGFRCTKPGL